MTDLAMCDWSDPGRDPYTGTPRAAISALVAIPPRVRAVLIEHAERNAYDDVVSITRNTVRGTHDYEPALSYMAFGTGRICVGVDRSKWSAERVEAGMVFCEDRWCVVRPSICNNWAIVARIFRRTDPPARPAPAVGPAVADRGTGPSPEVNADPQPPSAALLDPAESAVGSAPFNADPVIWARWPELPAQAIAPIAPIPEPSTWALLAAGVVAIAVWRKRAARSTKQEVL